jgi:hypothetical protein
VKRRTFHNEQLYNPIYLCSADGPCRDKARSEADTEQHTRVGFKSFIHFFFWKNFFVVARSTKWRMTLGWFLNKILLKFPVKMPTEAEGGMLAPGGVGTRSADRPEESMMVCQASKSKKK